MRRRFLFLCLILFPAITPFAESASAVDAANGENIFFRRLNESIPADKFKSVEDLYKRWQELKAGTGKAVILNVLPKEEFDRGHIEGSYNVDISRVQEVPQRWPDPDTEIWVHCSAMHRATYFAALLYEYGYRNVYVVQGGINGWRGRYPVINKYLGEIQLIDGDTARYK